MRLAVMVATTVFLASFAPPGLTLAAISSLGLSFGLWLLEMSASDSRSFLRAISPNAHFQNLNMGLVNSADLIYFALLIAVLLWLTIRHLNDERLHA